MARQVTFAFERRSSPLFGLVHRPMAMVGFWSQKTQGWVRVAMLVDTGADYTLLPHIYANYLGIRLDREGHVFTTMGVGGKERVYLVPEWPMELGSWRRDIPIGFLMRNDIPPLLGRQSCLETFKLTLFQRRSTFAIR